MGEGSASVIENALVGIDWGSGSGANLRAEVDRQRDAHQKLRIVVAEDLACLRSSLFGLRCSAGHADAEVVWRVS